MNRLVEVFKLLSDSTRLRVVMILAQEELCVCQITGILKIPQPKVSKCLSKLRDMNLAVDERRDKFVFYRLRSDQPVFASIIGTIADNLEQYPQLVTDRARLAGKEQYLNQCCVNSTL